MIQWSCSNCGFDGMSTSPDLVPSRCPKCKTEFTFRTPNWDRLTYDEPHKSRSQKGYPEDTQSLAFKTAEWQNDLGWEWLQREDFGQALAHFESALQECPQFAMVWNNKGWAHYHLGQIIEAKNAYLKSIELAPKFSMPYLNLGVLYLEAGNKSEARLWFNKAVAANPNDKDVADYVRKIDWR